MHEDAAALKQRLLESRQLLSEALERGREALAAATVSSRTAEAKTLDVRAVADRLGVSPKTVYRLLREGRIPYLRVGRSLRFRAPQIGAWTESCSFLPALRRPRSHAGR